MLVQKTIKCGSDSCARRRDVGATESRWWESEQWERTASKQSSVSISRRRHGNVTTGAVAAAAKEEEAAAEEAAAKEEEAMAEEETAAVDEEAPTAGGDDDEKDEVDVCTRLLETDLAHASAGANLSSP